MTGSIIDKLDQLADFQAQKDYLSLQKKELIDQAIPPEIRQRLEEIEDEFAGRLEAVDANIERLEAEVRADVLNIQASQSGSFLQAIWNRGRVQWDTRGLEGYAREHPEILSYRKEGDPFISIRKKNQG